MPELSWALREMNRAAATVDHRLAERMHLRSIEYAAMQHVMDAPDAIGPAELIGRLGISTRLGHRAGRPPRGGRTPCAASTSAGSAANHPSGDRESGDLGHRELARLLADIDTLATEFTAEEQEVIARYLRSAAGRMRRFADGNS